MAAISDDTAALVAAQLTALEWSKVGAVDEEGILKSYLKWKRLVAERDVGGGKSVPATDY